MISVLLDSSNNALSVGIARDNELVESVSSSLKNVHKQVGEQPVVLCSPRIRLPLYQLLELHIPTITVVSYSELITDIRVEAVETVGVSESN